MKKILILLLSLIIAVSAFAERQPEEFNEGLYVTGDYDGGYRNEVVDYDIHINAAVEYLLRMFSDVTEDLSGNGFVDSDRNDAGWEWSVTEDVQQHRDLNSSDNTRSQGVYGAFLTYERTGDERLITMLEDYCNYVISYSEYLDEHIIITYDGEGNITAVDTDCFEPYDETDSYSVGAIYDASLLMTYQNMPQATPDIYKNAAREMVVNYHYWCVYDQGYADIGERSYMGRQDASGTYDMLIPWDMESRVDALSKMFEAFPADPIFDDPQFDPNNDWDNWADYAETCVGYLYNDPEDRLPGVEDLLEPGSWTHHTGDKYYFMLGMGSLIYNLAQMNAEPYTSAMQSYIDWSLEYMVYETGSAAGDYHYNPGNYYNYTSGTQTIAFMNKGLGAADSEAYLNQINRAAYNVAKSQDLNTGGWYFDDNGTTKHNPPVAGERLYALAYSSGYNEVYVDAATGSDDNDGSEGSPFATIQKGVYNAAGGIVHVEAGTYNENILFQQTCKVIGENGTVTIQPDTPFGWNITYDRGSVTSEDPAWTDILMESVILVYNIPEIAQGVILENITIDCSLIDEADLDPTSTAFAGLAVYESATKFDNVTVIGNDFAGIDCYGIFADAEGGDVDVNILNSDISAYSTAGINVSGAALTAVISTTTITGTTGSGIIAADGVTATIGSSNDINGGDYGINVIDTADGIVIEENNIDNCATGINVNGYATTQGVGNIEVTGNVVTTGRATGIGIDIDGAQTSNAVILYNTFAELNEGIAVGIDAGTGNEAHYNNLNGCDTAIANSGVNSFDGDWNYYGTSPVTGTVTQLNPLSAPNNYVSAPVISESADVIALSWNEIQDADSYKVYSATTADGSYTVLDGAVLTNGYNYNVAAPAMFFKVSAVSAGVESQLSEASGYVNYTHTYNAETTNQLFIGYGFDMGYEMASDFIESEIGIDNCTVISKWNNTIQAWQSAAYLPGLGWDGDFEMVYGQAYMLGFENDANVYISGNVDNNAEYSFVATTTTNINSAIVPLDSALTDASLLGDTITNCQIISHWVQAEQGWETATYISAISTWVGDFNITVGQPLMVGVSDNTTWTP